MYLTLIRKSEVKQSLQSLSGKQLKLFVSHNIQSSFPENHIALKYCRNTFETFDFVFKIMYFVVLGVKFKLSYDPEIDNF